MAKIVLTLLDGKVLTRDNKAIGSGSGCCCCFCSETCERCVLVDVEFGTTTLAGPPIYQMLDKTAYAPDPQYCAEIHIVVSHTTAEWANGTYPNSNTLFSTWSLDKVGYYAEEVKSDGTKTYKTRMPSAVAANVYRTWAQEPDYVNLPDNNLYVAYVAPSGDQDKTRQQLYLFCLKGDGTDGPFATKLPIVKPKKIFNIDIDLHKCGWVLVVQKSTCSSTVDADSSCSMNFVRIPSDDTGCPKIGNYNTVSTFLSPTEIAAKDPPIECPDDHEDKLEDKDEVAVVCENDSEKDPGVYEIADCDSRQAALVGLPGYNNNSSGFWPRTEGVGGNKGKWGGAIPYRVKVRKTIRKTKALSQTVGTTLCCVPDGPEAYYYFIQEGAWADLNNWRVDGVGSTDIKLVALPSDSDIPTYERAAWTAGGKIPLSLPTKMDRVVIQKSVFPMPDGIKVLSMDVVNTTAGTKVLINSGTISTTEFSLFSENTQLGGGGGKLLGTGKIIFRDNSKVDLGGTIGDSTATSDFTLIKFKHSAINNGEIYHRFCTIAGQTDVAKSIERFVNFHDTSSNASVTKTNFPGEFFGGNIYYTPAKFYDKSTNSGTVCKNFGKNASTSMDSLVENEGYPRSYFEDESTNAANGKVVGTATFNNYSLNLGEIDNSVDPYTDKSKNSAKFYGEWPPGAPFSYDSIGNSKNGSTGYIKGYAEFYEDSTNCGDVDKNLTLYDRSKCLYEAGNTRSGSGNNEAIHIGQNLIMKDRSTLNVWPKYTVSDYNQNADHSLNLIPWPFWVTYVTPITPTLTIRIGGMVVLDGAGNCAVANNCGSFITGASDDPTGGPIIIKNCIIYVRENTHLYGHTTVIDSNIFATETEQTMSINHTSVTMDQDVIAVSYTTAEWNTNLTGSNEYPLPFLGPANCQLERDYPGVYAEQILTNGLRAYWNGCRFNNTYQFVLFGRWDNNLKRTIEYDIINFKNSAINGAKIHRKSQAALARTTFYDSSINRSEDVTGTLRFMDESRNSVARVNPDVANHTFDTIVFSDESANLRLITSPNSITFNSDSYNDAGALIVGNVVFNGSSENRGTSPSLTLTIDPSSATLYDTDPEVNPETHPVSIDGLTAPNTIVGNNITYSGASTNIINNLADEAGTVATLETTPAGTYTYSINSVYYEINVNVLSRNYYWFLEIETSLIQDIPTSLTVTTTNTATNETFETILTITYTPPE